MCNFIARSKISTVLSCVGAAVVGVFVSMLLTAAAASAEPAPMPAAYVSTVETATDQVSELTARSRDSRRTNIAAVALMTSTVIMAAAYRKAKADKDKEKKGGNKKK